MLVRRIQSPDTLYVYVPNMDDYPIVGYTVCCSSIITSYMMCRGKGGVRLSQDSW